MYLQPSCDNLTSFGTRSPCLPGFFKFLTSCIFSFPRPFNQPLFLALPCLFRVPNLQRSWSLLAPLIHSVLCLHVYVSTCVCIPFETLFECKIYCDWQNRARIKKGFSRNPYQFLRFTLSGSSLFHSCLSCHGHCLLYRTGTRSPTACPLVILAVCRPWQ